MKFDKILEYQKLDMEYLAIEDSLRNSRERALYNALKSKQNELVSAQERFFGEAQEILSQEERLDLKSKELATKIAEIGTYIDKASDLNEIEFYSKQLSSLFDELTMLQRDVERDLTKSDGISFNYKISAEEKLKADTQLRSAEISYAKIHKEKENEATPIYVKTKQLKSEIEPELLRLYKQLRDNRKLPAFVEYSPEDKRCGRCFMDIASDTQSKLKKPGDYAECPNCHRVLFLPD